MDPHPPPEPSLITTPPRTEFLQDPALLLVAHGTRDPRGAEEMDVLTALLRDRLGVPVAHAWLEDFAEPDVSDAVSELVQAGVRRIVSLPLLTLGAGHAKTDVPTLVAEARHAFPAVEIEHGRVLGLHPALFALARRRIDAVSAPSGRAEEVLVVAASGSSDPDANGDLAKAARFLAEGTGHRWVEHCFAGVTWPAPGEALRRVASAGARRAVVFSWSLLAGLLEQRVADAAAEVAAETGLAVTQAGRFGPDERLAEAVADRYHEVLHGDIRANCDLCCYRVPLPGLESRVGAPSGGGVA
jgi:sirohydrochlorin cobaltochelatase